MKRAHWLYRLLYIADVALFIAMLCALGIALWMGKYLIAATFGVFALMAGRRVARGPVGAR